MLARSIFIILLLNLSTLFSQQESFLSFYKFNMNIINPAFAGSEDKSSVSILSRTQWISIDNSPKTQAFIFSSPRKKNVGLGISIISNKYFIEQNSSVYLDFSYKLNISDNSNLYLGLKAAGSFFKANLFGLGSNSGINDPAKQSFSSFNPNFGVGALFKSNAYWLSFSIPRLFKISESKDFTYTSFDRIHTYISGGLNIKITDDFIFKPSYLLRIVNELNSTNEFTGMLEFKKLFQIGSFYRSNKTTGIQTTLNLKELLDFGYAYEIPFDRSLSSLSVKNHEVFLRFKIKIKGGENEKSDEIGMKK